MLSIYASITTTTTIFSDLYLPNGLLLQGIIIIVWVKFFQRWIILAENPIKKLELFSGQPSSTHFVPFEKEESNLIINNITKIEEEGIMLIHDRLVWDLLKLT